MGLIGAGVAGLLLTERLDLLAPTRVRDGSGGWTETWAVQATVNGVVYSDWHTTPGENLEGAAPTTEVRNQILLDAQGVTPTPGWRIRRADGATTYEIVLFQPQGTLLLCVGRKV